MVDIIPTDSEPEDVPTLQQIEPLDEETVRSIVASEIENAIGGSGDGSGIAEERRLALRYYQGKLLGNEIEGRSQVILTDVADTIEWIMPTMMRMLCPGGKRITKLNPKKPGDEAKKSAKKATKAVNHIIMEQNDGFMKIYEFVKTLLIEKRGFLKTYYEERLEPKKSVYRGLDDLELAILLEDEGLHVVEFEERQEFLAGQMVPVFDVTVQNRAVRGQIKIDGFPPDEFLIAPRELGCNDDTRFCAHQKKMMISDLLAMGFDETTVLNAPTDDSPEYSEGRTERFAEEESFPFTNQDRPDVASREVWVTECYLRIDEDGDGYSEYRKIIVIGDDAQTLLDDEEISHNPITSACPVPMPHAFWGMSIADLVMDLQKIRSVLLRAMMDNLFLANNPRTEVVEGQVNVDDLLTSRPGNIVRVRAPGMMREVTTEAFSPMAMQMMEFLGGEKENRTGITKYNQGQDADSLNQTAHGLSQIMTAAAARVELLARIIAQTGIRSLAKNVYQTLKESPMKAFEVLLDDGDWMSIDPNEFHEDLDVEVVVGLGVGAAQERVQNLQMLLDLQSQIVERGYGDYLVTAKNVYETLDELVDSMEFAVPNRFFSNPDEMEQPPPKPAPQVEVQKMKGELEQEKLKLENVKAETEVTKEAALVRHRAEDLAQTRELELKRMTLDAGTRIRIAQIQADATLEAARQNAQRAAAASKGNGADQPSA